MNQNILILNIKSLDRLKTPMNKVINVKYGIFKNYFSTFDKYLSILFNEF